MRNVFGRKVLSAAKQIFYFFHIKSSIPATSHPGSSCPEEWVRPVPNPPAGYCLFSPKTEWIFTVIRAVCVTLWVGTILRIHTCPSCCRQPSSSAPATGPFPTFCSIWYPFPGAVFAEILLLLFCLQYILSLAHDSKPQHPIYPILPVHWHWRPQSSFQSLNKDLACGEIDSCYPVLRKTFRQGKLIISLTVIPLFTGIEATTTSNKTTQRDVTCPLSLFYLKQEISTMPLAMNVFFGLQHYQTELNSKHGIRKFQK